MNPQICDECKKPCDGCMVMPGVMTEPEMMEVLGNGNVARGYAVLHRIIKGLYRARRLHPVFAEGKYQALGRVGAEYGELVQAIEKGEGENREKAEMFDTIFTLIRMINDEHKPPQEKETHGAVALV